MARDRASASWAREDEMARDESLRAVARVRREEVRAAWVWEEDSRSGGMLVVVVVEKGVGGCAGWAEGWRLRRVEWGDVSLRRSRTGD